MTEGLNPKDLIGAKKAPLGVVPPALALAAAPAMAIGANKYGPFNWRGQPVQAMTYIEAALRHLYAWIDGQDDAEDTGVSHIGHALASLGILADAIAQDNLIDNRPPKGPAADMLREQDKSVVAKPAVTYMGIDLAKASEEWVGTLSKAADEAVSKALEEWAEGNPQDYFYDGIIHDPVYCATCSASMDIIREQKGSVT